MSRRSLLNKVRSRMRTNILQESRYSFVVHTRTFDGIAAAVLAILVSAMYVLLPKQGDIWYTDSSRHAMNGAFILDFLRTMPIHHPMGFALDYYRQWPALTIGLYPPLFYMEVAASYAVFGVSEAAALIPALISVFLLGWGAYRLSQNWLDNAPALAVALLAVGTPGAGFWGRQIVLDVSMYAWLIWAALFHLRYLKGDSPRNLYLAVVCTAGAMYTKYNAAFFIGVMVLSILYTKGWRSAFHRTTLRAAALGLVLLLPLLFFFFKFATFNLMQAGLSEYATVPRWSFAGLTYYTRFMPNVLSWAIVVLAVAFCIGALVPQRTAVVETVKPKFSGTTNDAAFLLIWLIFGYVFSTVMAMKDPRYTLPFTYPIILASVLFLDWIASRSSLRGGLALAAASVISVVSLVVTPPPYVTGMRQAAQDIAKVAPQETNVAYLGHYDGTFIYGMRAYGGRPDLGIVRLSKVLINYTVMLEWGFTQKNWNAEQIIEQLRNLHVQYVAVEAGYGADIQVIKNLNAALGSDRFREVGRIKMQSNYPVGPTPVGTNLFGVTEVVIYRAVEDVPRGLVAPSMELNMLGQGV
jgi:Dolichyl-phosphate-mannose-protein mannosyltransferase